MAYNMAYNTSHGLRFWPQLFEKAIQSSNSKDAPILLEFANFLLRVTNPRWKGRAGLG